MPRRRSAQLTDAKLCVVYVRVSTPEQARGMSLDGQLADIRDHAAREGLTIVRDYVERGATATDDNRPAFRKMLDALYAPDNRIGTILLVHSSRFMRDATKARIHKAALAKRGIRVVSIQQPVEDDPTGRFVEGMFELIDQLESEQIGRRTRAAMKQNARAGYWNGSKAPFGYRMVAVPSPGESE